VRLAGNPQALHLGMQSGLDGRVSPQTATQVDAETRRIVEDALEQAWSHLEMHGETLSRLAGRLVEQETVGGDELAEMLSEAGGLQSRDAATAPVSETAGVAA
jgi:cell division protease FtsH